MVLTFRGSAYHLDGIANVYYGVNPRIKHLGTNQDVISGVAAYVDELTNQYPKGLPLFSAMVETSPSKFREAIRQSASPHPSSPAAGGEAGRTGGPWTPTTPTHRSFVMPQTNTLHRLLQQLADCQACNRLSCICRKSSRNSNIVPHCPAHENKRPALLVTERGA
jgi:hypothetical protein